LDSAYVALLDTLSAKIRVLDRLHSATTFPQSEEEIAALEQVAQKFDLLIRRTTKAADAMSAYIKELED